MANNQTASAVKQMLEHIRKPKLQRNDIITMALSFFGALFLWVYIVSSISSDYTVSFSKLPVTADLTGTRTESLDLDLLPESEELLASLTVDCTISGTRAAIGALSRSDVEAYVDFDTNVSDTIGKQTFSVRLRTTNGAVFSNAELSVRSVELELDRYQTVDIPVNEVVYPYLIYDEETLISTADISYEPSTVKIYGPSTQLSALDHIRVTVDNTEELTQTKTFSDCTAYSLIDSDGNTVDTTPFQVQATRFAVRIPVYYSRKLPVTVNIINTPTQFDVDSILKRIRITANGTEYMLPEYGDNNLMLKIETTDPNNKAKLDQLESWAIEPIPLSSLALGSAIDVPVKMEDGFTDSSNLGSVHISLDGTDLKTETRWLKNSEIALINPDQRYDYALESPGGNTPVTLIGTAEELAMIDTEDLKASINLIGISVTNEGVYTQVFSVTLPDTVRGVWVSPTPSVNIEVSLAN